MSDGPNPQPGGGGNDIPLTPPGCFTAPPPAYGDGARRYHEDLCQPVAMLPTLRFMSEYPSPHLGRFEPRSITPIRAVDFTPNEAGGSKCRHHYGHITMSKRGRMEPFHASEPLATSAAGETIDLRRNHRMLVCRLEGNDPEGIIPRGRFFYRGSYQAPWHTDLHVHSLRVYCGTPD